MWCLSGDPDGDNQDPFGYLRFETWRHRRMGVQAERRRQLHRPGDLGEDAVGLELIPSVRALVCLLKTYQPCVHDDTL